MKAWRGLTRGSRQDEPLPRIKASGSRRTAALIPLLHYERASSGTKIPKSDGPSRKTRSSMEERNFYSDRKRGGESRGSMLDSDPSQGSPRSHAHRRPHDCAGNGSCGCRRRAVVVAQRACDSGDVRACLGLANLYWSCKVTGWVEGKMAMQALSAAVTVDATRAANLSREACARRDGRGCLTLGFMFLYGMGTERDTRRAAALFDEARRVGALQGCVELSLLYEAGEGVPNDLKRAAKLSQQACDQGSPTACEILGLACLEGTTVPVNKKRGMRLLRRACETGGARACYELGVRYESGDGQARDRNVVDAVRLHERACGTRVALACERLGWMYQAGEMVSRDLRQAAYWYRKACEAGAQPACALADTLGASATP